MQKGWINLFRCTEKTSSGMFKVTHEVIGYRKEMSLMIGSVIGFVHGFLTYSKVYQDQLFTYTFLSVSSLENVEAVIKQIYRDLSILEISIFLSSHIENIRVKERRTKFPYVILNFI